ncbi:MAG: hypothetical protein V4507_06895 [Verrucomicrobiota bacterium]
MNVKKDVFYYLVFGFLFLAIQADEIPFPKTIGKILIDENFTDGQTGPLVNRKFESRLLQLKQGFSGGKPDRFEMIKEGLGVTADAMSVGDEAHVVWKYGLKTSFSCHVAHFWIFPRGLDPNSGIQFGFFVDNKSEGEGKIFGINFLGFPQKASIILNGAYKREDPKASRLLALNTPTEAERQEPLMVTLVTDEEGGAACLINRKLKWKSDPTTSRNSDIVEQTRGKESGPSGLIITIHLKSNPIDTSEPLLIKGVRMEGLDGINMEDYLAKLNNEASPEL